MVRRQATRSRHLTTALHDNPHHQGQGLRWLRAAARRPGRGRSLPAPQRTHVKRRQCSQGGGGKACSGGQQKRGARVREASSPCRCHFQGPGLGSGAWRSEELEGAGFADSLRSQQCVSRTCMRVSTCTRTHTRSTWPIPQTRDTHFQKYFVLLKKILVLLKAYENSHPFKLKLMLGIYPPTHQ